jgi:hypothetical protein
MNIIPLKNAVLCGDCDCITEATGHTCPVCQSTALASLAVHIEPLPHIDERTSPATEPIGPFCPRCKQPREPDEIGLVGICYPCYRAFVRKPQPQQELQTQ